MGSSTKRPHRPAVVPRAGGAPADSARGRVGSGADLDPTDHPELPEADARYRVLADQTADAIFLVDGVTLRIIDTNRSASELTGYRRAELIGASISKLVSEDDRPAQLARIGAVGRGASRVSRSRLRHKDRSLLGVELRERRLEDGRVLAVIRPTAGSDPGEGPFRRMVTSFDLFAATVDGRGLITYANPALSQLTGWSVDELIGRSAYGLLRAASASPPGGGLSDEYPVSNLDHPIETEIVTRSGASRRVAISSTLLRDQFGATVGAAVLGQDLSLARAGRSALERELRRRSDVAAAISRLEPGGSTEETALKICKELRSLNGVDFSVAVVFGADGDATVMAMDAPRDLPMSTGATVPAARAAYLIERAARGPWVERWRRREEDGEYGRAMTAANVSGVSYAPIRYGDTTLGLLVAGSMRSQHAEIIVENLPVISEFGSAASALLALDLQAERVRSERRVLVQGIVAQGAFQPVYQPIVELTGGETVGYEALTRFVDGEPPDTRFATAWTVGKGAELELATLERAIRVGRRLPSGCWLNVNISPRLLEEPARLRSVLERADRTLVLEITEHEVITDYRAAREALIRLGPVLTAVDDAGAGIANFAHIVELRPNFVKLDIGLVRGVDTDLPRQAMIVAMSHFARSTGCQLIAEGVETRAEARTVRSLEVDFGQGYWYWRPTPIAELLAAPVAKPRLARRSSLAEPIPMVPG